MAANLVPTEGGSPIALDKPIMLIGRNQSCDISLQTSSKVSRRHCCIVQCGRKYLMRDLGSMNGVRVNAHRVVEIELQAGDQIAVADVQFHVSPSMSRKEGCALESSKLRLPPDVTSAGDAKDDVSGRNARCADPEFIEYLQRRRSSPRSSEDETTG